ISGNRHILQRQGAISATPARLPTAPHRYAPDPVRKTKPRKTFAFSFLFFSRLFKAAKSIQSARYALGRERSRGAKPYGPDASGRARAGSSLRRGAAGLVEASGGKGRRPPAKQGGRRALGGALGLCPRFFFLWPLGYGFSCRPP